jgi:GT2 family glycosyltransferase
MNNESFAVLMTCHNRKNATLLCLDKVYKNTIPSTLTISIFLVDDGSTDGTEKAVAIKYPEVNIIKGDGSLFWNGGMRLAWNEALKGEFDYYLWINDDSMIYEDSIARLLFTYNKLSSQADTPGAILGTMVDPKSKKPTYGGRISVSKLNPLKFGEVIRPSNEPTPCDFINGNLTLIPAESVKKIGILSNAFTHSMGDFDYGLRLKKAGSTCWVAPGVYGECEQNSEKGGCKDANISAAERVKIMQQLSQLPPVDEWKYFVRQHGGVLWLILWFKAFIRGKYPHLWVMLRGQKR